MSAEQWSSIYEHAWHLYYSPAHLETLIRRWVANGSSGRRVADHTFYFYALAAYERVHPLQGGLFRRKCRTQRRSGLPLESRAAFCVRRVREMVGTYSRAAMLFLKIHRMRRRIARDPLSASYSDLAIAPIADTQDDELQLFQQSDAARQAVARVRAREELIRAAVH